MLIKKNKRGGFLIKGTGDLILTKRGDIWLELDGLENSDFKDWNVIMNCKEQKEKALNQVIKWLYNLK